MSASQANSLRSNPPMNLLKSSPQNHSFLGDIWKSKPMRCRCPVFIRASSSKPQSLVKTARATLTVTAALFSANYFITSSPPAISLTEAKHESYLQEEDPDNVQVLLSLTKIKFKSDKKEEALGILNRLIEIHPKQEKYKLMKARMLSLMYKEELAIEAYEEILINDPNHIEAYHYLVMEYRYCLPELKQIEIRINQAIQRYNKKLIMKKRKQVRDLRLLIAQIRALEGNFVEAIKISQELSNEDPEDYKIYLLQGFVYVLMKKKDKANRQFYVFDKLLQEDHPHKYIDLHNDLDEFQWKAILGYDSTFCYVTLFARLRLHSCTFGMLKF